MTASGGGNRAQASPRSLLKSVAGVQKLQLKRSSRNSTSSKSPQSQSGLLAQPSPATSTARAPGTPPAEEAALCSSAHEHILGSDVTHAIRAALQIYHKNLVRIQPIVQISRPTMEGAVALLAAAASMEPQLLARLHDSCPHLLVATASSLWVAAKVMGVRGHTPSGNLLGQATQIDLKALLDMETFLLKTLDWQVTAILRGAGVLVA